MLDINAPEVIAAQVGGSYAARYNESYKGKRSIEVVSNPLYQGTDNIGFGDVFFVPVHVHGPNGALRAGDIIVSIKNGNCTGCSLR